MLNLLLAKGASIDLRNAQGETSLYIASLIGHKEIVELLISKGALIDLVDTDGKTPLWVAM